MSDQRVEALRRIIEDDFGEARQTYVDAEHPAPKLIEVLLELWSLLPEDWNVIIKTVNALIKGERPADALALINRSLASACLDVAREQPLSQWIDLSGVLNTRSHLLWTLDRRDEAVDQIRNRLKIKSDVATQETLVVWLSEMEQHEEVIEVAARLEHLVVEGHRLPGLGLALGKAHKALGGRDHAVRVLWGAFCAGADLDLVTSELRSLGYKIIQKGGEYRLKKRGLFG